MTARKLFVLDAPSNLGLTPPAAGLIPGCYKLPWALRDRDLVRRIDGVDAGCVVPPRYDPTWTPGSGDRNAAAIADYSRLLADRVDRAIEGGARLLALGGDCSILMGNMLALRRRGRFGLVFIDAHSDYRHPGNSDRIGAAAGEDLAIVTGKGDGRLVDLEGRSPYVRLEDVHVVGVRPDDEYLGELRSSRIATTTSREITSGGAQGVVEEVLETVTRSTEGFWVHFDADAIDSDEVWAVDSPGGPGPSLATLGAIVHRLFLSPKCVGMELTVFDPDLDPDGTQSDRLTEALVRALATNSDEPEVQRS